MTSPSRDIAPNPLPLGTLLLLFLAMAFGGLLGEIDAWRIAAIVAASSAAATLVVLLAFRILRQGDDLLAELLEYGDEAEY